MHALKHNSYIPLLVWHTQMAKNATDSRTALIKEICLYYGSTTANYGIAW